MTTPPHPTPREEYVLDDDRYVLYLGSVRVLATEIVAVLIDTRLPMLITHGDPVSVRRELDEMREVLRASRAPHYEKDWLLLEGRPEVAWLNRVIAQPATLAGIEDAFTTRRGSSAQDITRRLLERMARQST